MNAATRALLDEVSEMVAIARREGATDEDIREAVGLTDQDDGGEG